MEPSSKRRKLAPKVPDPPVPPATSPAVAPQQQAQPPAQAFPQEQHLAQQYPPPEAVAPQSERHDFEAFARHLQDAAMHIHQQTLKPHHTSVSVLLLRWEEDMSVEPDLLALEKVFKDQYKYNTTTWAIPTVANPSIKLGVQMAAFLEHARPDHLLIIYYAGHGFIGPDKQLYWASNTREDAAKLKWDGVRCLFEDAQSEILLLLDSCAIRDAPMAGNHGGKQAIAAYTPEQSPHDVGPRSFTASLADALHRLSGGRPFSSQRLYEEVLAVRQQDAAQPLARLANGAAQSTPPSQKTPVFFTLTPSKGQGIVLVPLDPTGAHLQSPPQSAEPENSNWKSGGEDRPLSHGEVVDLTFDEARVLVCTTFVGDASPDMAFFNQWLQNTPPVASKITVQGMFLGPPTMLLISMPVSIWNIVQHDKVCCFLGYVSSHNMIHLYQRLVASASHGVAGPVGPGETRPVAPAPAIPANPASSPTTGRREPAPQFPEPARRQEGPRTQTAAATQAASHAAAAFAHVQATPVQAMPAQATPVQAAPAQALATASGSNAKDDVEEESAEMKEAAEQLKALSHVRHTSDETRSTLDRSNSRVGDSIAVRYAGDPVSSPETNGSAFDDVHNGGGSEFNTPSSKPKARRPLQKQTPKQETQCPHCTQPPFKDSSSLRKHVAAAHTRPFPCAFSFAGCASTFGSKNEWKRHIASQHLCLQYYRCSQCPPSTGDGKGNEFNRKDLFTQHLRRMHAPFAIKKSLAKNDSKMQADWDTHLKEMQTSCLVTRRQPPQRSACPKPDCQSVFEGPGSWDEWTEHVGRHMEKGEASRLGVDGLLADWALEEGIIEEEGDGVFKLVSSAMGMGMGMGMGGGLNGSANGGNGNADGASLLIVNENGHGHGSSSHHGHGHLNTSMNGHAQKNGSRSANAERTAGSTAIATSSGSGASVSAGISTISRPERSNGSNPPNIKHGPGYGHSHGRLRVEMQHGGHVKDDDIEDDGASIVVATTAPPLRMDDDGMDID